MADTSRIALLALAMVAAVTVASPSQARRSSGGIRDTSYCRNDGCFSRDASSGFYCQKLNADGGISRRSDGTSNRRRSRY